jgi:hypothetical protein
MAAALLLIRRWVPFGIRAWILVVRARPVELLGNALDYGIDSFREVI